MKKTNTGNYRAILAYITFIGLIIAYVLNRDKQDKFVTYHIKNMFGLVLLLFISQLLQTNDSLLFLGEIVWVISFFLWVYSLLMAILNKKAGIPILTDHFQKWFSFLD
jgi:uncharacterized membrane protein